MELNGARRKNATRETTSVLKAWLNEHKKNPYPTKGEKIMLAIITKMTLTQVSTWFANARRRLKKENKMTWEPKNRVDDDDPNICDDDDDDDNKSLDGMKSHGHHSMKDSGGTSSEDGDNPQKCNRLNDNSHMDSNPGSPEMCDITGGGGGGGYPMYHPMQFKPVPKPDFTQGSSTAATVNSKPRIWSLADMANNDKDHKSEGTEYGRSHPQMGMYGANVGPDGMLAPSSMAGRTNTYPHFSKTDLFRNFTRSHAATHLGQPDYALLESYQRALVVHNGLATMHIHPHHLSSMMVKPLGESNPAAAAAAAAAAASAAASFTSSANLTTKPTSGLTGGHSQHPQYVAPARPSPSSSSTSSRPENSTPSSLNAPLLCPPQHPSSQQHPTSHSQHDHHQSLLHNHHQQQHHHRQCSPPNRRDAEFAMNAN